MICKEEGHKYLEKGKDYSFTRDGLYHVTFIQGWRVTLTTEQFNFYFGVEK